LPVKTKTSTFIALATGCVLCAFVVTPATSASLHSHDDEKPVEEKSKKKTKRIKVVRSGVRVDADASNQSTVVIERDGKQFLHKYASENSNYKVWISKSGEAQAKALVEAKESLEKVEARLKKSRKSSEKDALRLAREALKVAIEGLEQPLRIEQSAVELLRDGQQLQAADQLSILQHQENDLNRMRVDALEELAGVRAELADALGDVEMEIGLDGEIKALRIQSLKRAAGTVEELEAEHLAALKKAELELRLEREMLEKRMAKRRAEKEKQVKEK
jgi:hypothetical protein